MKNLNLGSEVSLTLKSRNCCDTNYYNTECPQCGSLFHMDENEQTYECPQCGWVVI